MNVISKEQIGSWVRFTVDIESVYKYNTEVLQRGQTQSLWVSVDDLNCKCPKLRTKNSYLIIGKSNDVECVVSLNSLSKTELKLEQLKPRRARKT